MKKHLLLIIFSLLAASGASAISSPPSYGGDNPGGCVTNESASIGIMLNGSNDDIDVVSGEIKAKTEEIKNLAKEEHFSKFTVQSSNYNIRSSNSNRFEGYAGNGDEKHGQYHYTGNINLSVQPSDKALHFMKVLTGKGYRANINVNSYSSGDCRQQY